MMMEDEADWERVLGDLEMSLCPWYKIGAMPRVVFLDRPGFEALRDLVNRALADLKEDGYIPWDPLELPGAEAVIGRRPFFHLFGIRVVMLEGQDA